MSLLRIRAKTNMTLTDSMAEGPQRQVTHVKNSPASTPQSSICPEVSIVVAYHSLYSSFDKKNNNGNKLNVNNKTNLFLLCSRTHSVRSAST